MKIKRIICRHIINKYLCCTRFFSLKRKLLKWAGLQIGQNVRVVGPLYFSNVSQISIGNNAWIGENFNVDGNGDVYIGDNVDIAPHVVINTGGHIVGSSNHRAGECIRNIVKIGNGTWICTRVTIVNQVTIGNGCVVAAGSVVISDVEDNLMVAGVPAITKKSLKLE